MALDPTLEEELPAEDETLPEETLPGQAMVTLTRADGAVMQVSEEMAEQLRERLREERQEQLARIDALGHSLSRSRAEAITARQASGIEDEWSEDEEFYAGIDDANRGEAKTTWRQKPPGQAIPKVEQSTRSTVFPNITGPYVDAASARIADMLLPTDDRSWSLGPTPIPEMHAISEGKIPPKMITAAMAQNPGQPEQAKSQLTQAIDRAKQLMALAKEKADQAQKRIEDWHVQSQWHAHNRLVIEDAARIGVGVLKGPIPAQSRVIAYMDQKVVVSKEISPASKRIDPWNFYPDAACGENIHNGSFTWERDYLTRKQLRELRGQPGYIDEQLDSALEEGPRQVTNDYKQILDPVADDTLKNKFEIWYFHGTAEKEDLEAAGCDCTDAKDPHVPAMIAMINNRVVKATMNPLDTGDFPYDVMVWRRRANHWTGIGVSRQIRTAQRIVTAATRNLMDNAGIAAGPMIVFRQGVVEPANGVATLAPRKIWYIAEEADEMADATKAIGVIKVDMLVPELMRIIELGLKLAEDVTGLPMLLQGQMGKAPDTVGGMTMLNNNASAVLRRLARLYDDRITEPHVRRYYYWLLQYGEDSDKGDFQIDARGSSALVERDLQNQAIQQMGSIVLDPRFGLDPKKWMAELLKSQRLDVNRFTYDDEQWQQIVQNMAKGPQDPRLEIAKMRAQLEAGLKAADQRFETQENALDRQLEIMLAGVEAELERERNSGVKTMSLDKIKALLAGKVIDVKSKQALFNDERRLKLATGSGI